MESAGVEANATSRAGVAHAALPGLSMALPVKVALWVVGAGLALLLSFAWTATTSVHNDFTQNVWLPARLLVDGANPYNPTRPQVDAALGSYAAAFKEFNSGTDYHFIYPVWLAALFAPFAAIPLLTATAIWRALNLLLLVWATGALLRSSNPVFRSLKPAVIAALAMTILLSLIYRESILTIYVGQFSIIELGILAGIWGWLISSAGLPASRRWPGDVLTGAALAVLATKPQALGLAVLLVALWAISRRRFAIPGAAVGTEVALLLAPLAVYPSSLGDWLGVVFGGQAQSQVSVSASVWGVSYQWLGGQSPWTPVAVALTVAGLAVMAPRWWDDLKDRHSPVPMSLALTLCINAVVSPYMLGYEHVLLLLPAMLYLAAAGPAGEAAGPGTDKSRTLLRLAIYSWLAVLPLLLVAVQAGLNGKEYPVVLQSLSMLVICWLLRLEWKRNAYSG